MTLPAARTGCVNALVLTVQVGANPELLCSELIVHDMITIYPMWSSAYKISLKAVGGLPPRFPICGHHGNQVTTLKQVVRRTLRCEWVAAACAMPNADSERHRARLEFDLAPCAPT